MTKTCKRLTGFTLIELLIVLTILVALFALLLPMIFQRNRAQRNQQARTAIHNLQGQLDIYMTENRRYPSTEEGLYALVFFPDNYGTLPIQPGIVPSTPGNPLMNGLDAANPMADNSGFGSMPNAQGFGTPGFDAQGFGMAGTDQMGNPMDAGGFDPLTGQPLNAMENMGGSFGTAGTMAAAALLPGHHNPNLYTQRRVRPDGIPEKMLIDPWGNPYRYDNTVNMYGVNQYTGEPSKPAIWSAGADEQDGTDDDLRNWDPVEAQQHMATAMQRVSPQSPMYGGAGLGTFDPANPMNQNMNVLDPSTGLSVQPQQQWAQDPNMFQQQQFGGLDSSMQMGAGGQQMGPGGQQMGPGGQQMGAPGQPQPVMPGM